MRQLSPHGETTCKRVRASAHVPSAAPVIETGDLVEQARRLIARQGYGFLLIERSVRPNGVSIRVDAIGADGARTAGIARTGEATMRTLCHAANAVLRQLAVQHGMAERIGLMTDGTGALFSPDRRAVRDTGWLGSVLSGAARGVTLAPFAPTGHWSRLTAPRPWARSH
ncbi:hypothetical protein BH10PSE15_BH10PSE15_18530 [soil metagenome]